MLLLIWFVLSSFCLKHFSSTSRADWLRGTFYVSKINPFFILTSKSRWPKPIRNVGAIIKKDLWKRRSQKTLFFKMLPRLGKIQIIFFGNQKPCFLTECRHVAGTCDIKLTPRTSHLVWCQCFELSLPFMHRSTPAWGKKCLAHSWSPWIIQWTERLRAQQIHRKSEWDRKEHSNAVQEAWIPAWVLRTISIFCIMKINK